MLDHCTVSSEMGKKGDETVQVVFIHMYQKSTISEFQNKEEFQVSFH